MSTNMGVPITDEDRKSRLENKFRLLDEKKKETPAPAGEFLAPKSLTAPDVAVVSEAQGSTQSVGSAVLDLTTEDTPAPFNFSELPPELKHRVCAIAISRNCTDRGRVHTMAALGGPPVQILKSVHGRPDRSPALLRVSRELRQICLPLYYETTDFIIKTAPRMDRTCPLSRWLASIGHKNALLIHHIAISFYEADRVYVELSIQPEPGAFPQGSVTLEWPQTRKGKTCTAVMIFKRTLGRIYPQASQNEHSGKPFIVETSNVVRVVNELFDLGKKAAGGVSKKSGKSKGYTMGDALWRGHSRGSV